MATVSDTSLSIAYSSTLTPEGAPPTQGSITTTVEFTEDAALTGQTATWSARIWYGGGTVDLDLLAGTITPDTAGVRQVETATVVAAAGATSSGNLSVTLTSSNVTGSPLAITVPLSATTHTTAALIAGAIVTALNNEDAITAQLTVTSNGADIVITDRFPRGNDGSLNLAITAGLGVSAVTSSTNTTAGVAGIIIDRLGGDGNDANGSALPACTAVDVLILAVSSESTDGVALECDSVKFAPYIWSSSSMTIKGNSTDNAIDTSLPINVIPDGHGILDVIVSAH